MSALLNPHIRAIMIGLRITNFPGNHLGSSIVNTSTISQALELNFGGIRVADPAAIALTSLDEYSLS